MRSLGIGRDLYLRVCRDQNININTKRYCFLLFFHHKVLNNGTDKVHEYRTPVKVCVVCGRTDKTDNNPIYYTKKRTPHSSLCIYEKELSKEALELPRWYKEDFLDKFAKPYKEEEVSE